MGFPFAYALDQTIGQRAARLPRRHGAAPRLAVTAAPPRGPGWRFPPGGAPRLASRT